MHLNRCDIAYMIYDTEYFVYYNESNDLTASHRGFMRLPPNLRPDAGAGAERNGPPPFPQKTRAPRCSRMEPGPSGVPHAHETRVKRAASRPSVSLFDSSGAYRADNPNASASSRNDFCFASKSCVMVTTINSVVLYCSLICRIRSFTCSLVPTIIRLRFS